MRKALMVGLSVLALAAAGAGYYALAHNDPIQSAKKLIARSNMVGAEQYLRQAVARHPDNPEAAFLLGKVDLSLGNPEAAELELRRARAKGYSQAAIVLPLGQAYLQQRHFNEVLRDFTVDSAPPGTRGDTLTLRAAAQLSLGDTPGARATSAQAEAAAPNEREVLLTAARIALAADDLAGASDRAQKVLHAEPNQPEAVLLTAEIAMRRNDAPGALAAAQQILAGNPNRQDARMIEARSLAALNRTEAARASVEKVLHGSPKNVGANYLEAMMAIQMGDYPAADSALTAISTVVSQLPRGFYFLAVTKLGMNQPAQAEEAATKFLSKYPDDPGGLKLMAFIDLARQHPDRVLALLRGSKLAAHPDADTLDLQGRALAMAGDVRDAKKSFEDASALAPKDVQILNRLAAAELSMGDATGAETELKRSLAISPNQRLAGEAIVQADLSRGDIPTAIADVERLRQRVGDAEEVGVLAAQVHIAGLDMDVAEKQLRDVLARFPDSRPAKLNLIRIYGLRGDAPGAEKLLEDMLRHHPDDEGALDVLLPALFATKQVDRAVTVAEAAHEAAPDNPGITAALAGTYVRAHQTARAVALLDRASAENNPQLDVLRARVLAADGKPDLAEQAYRAAIREVPGNLRARSDLAGLLVAAKRYDDARGVLHEGLERSPGNEGLLGALVGVDLREHGIQAALAGAAALRADPQNQPGANALAGDAWLTQGDARQAAAAFLAAFKAAPSGELATKAANALSRSGGADQAIALLSDWVAKHPDDIPAQSVLSSLDLDTGKLGDAEQHLNAVLAVRRTDPASLNNLAWIKQQQGDGAAAKSLAERAYFQAPNPDVADTLGWILARQGDTPAALPLLSEAVTNLPDGKPGSAQAIAKASAAYHYGFALNASGRTEDARTQLQAALASPADFTGKADAQKLLSSLK